MKKALVYLIAALLILCMVSASAESAGKTVMPLPNTTMEALDDSTFAASLEEGDAYLDDSGKMHMSLSVYTYDLFDMVDIATLAVGDVIVMCGEDVAVTSVETTENGTVLINGGLEMDGYDLVTDESGVYYAVNYNDAKYWYLAGYADYPVSTEFTYTDSSDLDKEEPVVFYPGDFLIEDSGIDYFFIPENTTFRIEAGEIVEMTRVYIP